jgi:hypothetical protein
VRAHTGDDDRAKRAGVEARGAEDEDLGGKVGEGDEVGEEGEVVDAVRARGVSAQREYRESLRRGTYTFFSMWYAA